MLNADIAFGSVVVFEKEYAYQAGETDSKLSCRAIALEQVKRLLLEEMGVYLETKTEVKNYQLTKDQITLLTAGVVGSEIVNEKWDGRIYYLKAKISADPEDVAKRVNVLRKDEPKTRELEDARKKTDELLNELEKLKSEQKTLKADKKKQKQREINIIIKGLSALDWFEKGNILANSGNFRDAFEALSNAIKSDPLYAQAYALRGYVNSVINNSKKALADYSKAISLKPDYDGVYYFRGRLYLQLSYDQAKEEFVAKVMKMDSKTRNETSEKMLNNFKYSVDNPNFQQGMRDLDKAIELNPNNVDVFVARGAAYCSIGEYKKGLNDYDRAIKIDPQNVEIYLARGEAYSSIGNNKQAINDYDKALEIDPKDARIYSFRGYHFAKNGSFEKGVDNIEKAIELDPQNAKYYYQLGWLFLNLGQAEKYVNALKISARLGNKDAQRDLNGYKIDW